MSDEMNLFWNILWALGGFIFGVLLIIVAFVFTENVIRVKIFNIFRRGAYGVIEVMTDNQQVVTKVINKLKDRETKVYDNTFSLDKSAFLLKDGISVIHYHYSNCLKPASWRPYDEIKLVYMIPTAVKVVANIPIPGGKKGEEKIVPQEVIIYGENMQPFQLPPQNYEQQNEKGEKVIIQKAPPLWTKIDEKTIRYEAISKPSEFASLVKANESEMEANAVLLRQKQLERLVLWVMAAVGVGVISLLLSGLAVYWLNQTSGSVNSMSSKIDLMNSTLTTIQNRTVTQVCPPIPITP